MVPKINLKEKIALFFLILWAIMMVFVVMALSGCNNQPQKFEKYICMKNIIDQYMIIINRK